MSIPPNSAPMAFVLTGNRAKSKPFYEQVLGLRVLGEDDHAVTFDLGNRTPLRLTQVMGHRGSAHAVLGWHVADLRSAMQALKVKGVTFKNYAGMGQDAAGVWASPDGGARLAWFTDPDGNVLSLTQFG